MVYRIMIVEDEYWTAMHLAMEVRDRGAVVVGPISSVPQAIELLAGDDCPHAVILDIQLRANEAFPFADLLMKTGIPFVLATGYEKEELPERFADIPHFVKPFSDGDCVAAALELAKAHALP
ncbi:MAG: response regulator [Alphaproteobacteria bacterium]|nr:response regulator [Alphaproteobacteria bacterium]